MPGSEAFADAVGLIAQGSPPIAAPLSRGFVCPPYVLSGHHFLTPPNGDLSSQVNAAAFAPELARIDREFSDSTGILVSNSWPTVSFRPSFAMTTALQALEQGDWSKAGHVSTDSEVKQSADPWGKRCEAYLDDDGIIRTEPHWFGDGSGWRYAMREKTPRTWIECESVGYTKRFGMEDPFNDLNKELYGVDPDGYITNQFRDALRMESK